MWVGVLQPVVWFLRFSVVVVPRLLVSSFWWRPVGCCAGTGGLRVRTALRPVRIVCGGRCWMRLVR